MNGRENERMLLKMNKITSKLCIIFWKLDHKKNYVNENVGVHETIKAQHLFCLFYSIIQFIDLYIS